ncbi:MAG: hypothetical protein COV68_04475 [Nitrospirae bacterium CG11_big_fil_rev_8_21_14_0_20_41_14]|nr:MAG: hypothetical protein COV68_04475 [Nitrospirae bacterium CG11_big_fil_rev_8_21_14_0_20_41_14]
MNLLSNTPTLTLPRQGGGDRENPPSRGRGYLYKSPLERGVGVCYPPSPGGRGKGRGIIIAQFR